jgi:hypothetical protein
MPLLPDEARLLFLASRPDAVCSETYLAALAASRPNWRAVGALAEREKLLPVLWNYMRQHAEFIPTEVQEAFRAQAAVTEFRMALTETALHGVVETLGREGIRVMLLKGAALASTVYGSFQNRPMGDFDILVPSGQAERAWQLMRAAGWVLELEGGEQFFDSHHHLPGLVDPKGLNLVLEIHRAMLPPTGPFTFDETELWRDARSIRLGGRETWVPSDVHQLLHLSVHFAWSHMFSGMGRTVRDIATILAAGPADWAQFSDVVVRARASTCAYWTLVMTRTLSGTPVPAEVLEALRPRQPLFVSHALERGYITTGLFGACPSVWMAKLLWSAGIQPKASGHGSWRPWQSNELFKRVFRLDRSRGVGERLSGQLRSGARWWRFAKALGSPQRTM